MKARLAMKGDTRRLLVGFRPRVLHRRSVLCSGPALGFRMQGLLNVEV